MVSDVQQFYLRKLYFIFFIFALCLPVVFAQEMDKRESVSGDVLNGTSIFSSPSASGGLGVRFTESDDAIRFFDVSASSGFRIRYAAETASLVMVQVNDNQEQRLILPATGSDFDQFQSQTLTLPIPENATVTIYLPVKAMPVSIDFVEFSPVQTDQPISNIPRLESCQPIAENTTPGEFPVLRIPLAVHVGGSGASDKTVCGILEEINQIWFESAGICFEMTIDRGFVNRGTPRSDRDKEKREELLNFWILRRGNLFPERQGANGVYLGSVDEAYTVLNPSLSNVGVIDRADYAAARTGAHELGHALGLNHQDCGSPCANLLMTTGRKGFELVTGTPASTDEISRSRRAAEGLPQRALSDTSINNCAAPRFID